MTKASTEQKRITKADFGKEKIELLYEDDAIAVIFKPSGMLSVAYPGSRAKTAQDALEALLRKKGTYSSGHKPLVVHRLDRDTSGVMMFALTEPAQKKIMDSWQKMVTERLYIAVAENPADSAAILPDSGTISAPLAYNAHNIGFVPKTGDVPNAAAKKLATRNAVGGISKSDNPKKERSIYERNLTLEHGKAAFKTISAVTHYKVLARGTYHTAFRLSLETGRKNQIRAHLAYCGYPLAGDENYRAKTDPFARLCLHARTLTFVHPYTQKSMHFEVPEPEEWLLCVKNSSGNVPAIWATSQTKSAYSVHGKNHKNGAPSKQTPNGARRIPKKNQSGMDFIARGTLKSRLR